jgi:hypothetical protein
MMAGIVLLTLIELGLIKRYDDRNKAEREAAA